MTPIYRWNGKYFGFIKGDCFFNAVSEYLGWITEDGRVWRADGAFLGEIEDGEYVLRRQATVTPARRARRATPSTPATPARRANRASRPSRAGLIDALDEFPGS